MRITHLRNKLKLHELNRLISLPIMNSEHYIQGDWTRYFLQGTRITRSCLSGRVVGKRNLKL